MNRQRLAPSSSLRDAQNCPQAPADSLEPMPKQSMSEQPTSALSYPFAYECSGCRVESTVTREEARGLYPDPDSPNAPEVVLQERGWVKGPDDGLYCSNCARAAGR